MKISLRDLFTSPDAFLVQYEEDKALFLDMDRAAYERSLFCDQRISPTGERVVAINTQPLVDRLLVTEVAPGPVRHIFHIAHCGSTLLARALDLTSASLVIREPLVLRQLGVEASVLNNPEANEDWAGRFDLVRRMLARRYDPSAPVVVKTNVPVNLILDTIVQADPDAPSILLYLPLEAYLLAVMRTDNHQNWVRSIHAELNGRFLEPGIDASSPVVMQAASLWLGQIRRFVTVLSTAPNSRSLDGQNLFDDPAPVIRAALDHFGITASQADFDKIIGGDLFSRYAKNPDVAYDHASRREQQSVLRQSMASELDQAREWAAEQMEEYGLEPHLARPLTGKEPALV